MSAPPSTTRTANYSAHPALDDSNRAHQRRRKADTRDCNNGALNLFTVYLFTLLVVRPWRRLRDILFVAAYWLFDYLTDLILWSLHLLSMMSGPSFVSAAPTFEEQFLMQDNAIVPSSSTATTLSNGISTSSSEPEEMDITLASSPSDSSSALKKAADDADAPWDLCSSSSTFSTLSMPSSPRRHLSPALKLVISTPSSPSAAAATGSEEPMDAYIDRHDHEHCLQSPFSDGIHGVGGCGGGIRVASAIDDAFHSSLLSAITDSAELAESSSSFLREDLRIATHSPLNFRISRELTGSGSPATGDYFFPSPARTTAAGGSVPPSPRMTGAASPPHRLVRRPISARSLSAMGPTISHDDKENIAPSARRPSSPPEGSPRLRRVTLRRGQSSFRSPRL